MMSESAKIQYFSKSKGDFSDTQQVTTTRRILLRFRGGSKFKYNIGTEPLRGMLPKVPSPYLTHLTRQL